jgi:sugar phosphate isomerase/epimerase
MTPEEHAEFQAAQRVAQEELAAWRKGAAGSVVSTFAPVKQAFADAGIRITYLVYNLNVKTTADEEVDYAFQMAKALGAVGITTTTQVSMAKRIAPFADRHQMMVGFHGHSNLTNPDEIATPASFAACLEASRFHMINLDIGHFTAANFDAIAYLKEQRPRVMSLHIKDRRRDNGPNTPFGEGDTPIRGVLELLKQNPGWNIPGTIEFEYPGDPLVEIPKCLDYCRAALA